MLRSVGELIGYDMNFFTTLARHPKLYKRFAVFGNYVRMKSSLRLQGPRAAHPAHLLALRVHLRLHSPHARVGRALGIEGEEVERIKQGPDAEGWSAFDAALLRAADELHADSVHLRCDLVHVGRAVLDRTAHGRRVLRRPVRAGLDGGELLRRPARGLGPRPPSGPLASTPMTRITTRSFRPRGSRA